MAGISDSRSCVDAAASSSPGSMKAAIYPQARIRPLGPRSPAAEAEERAHSPRLPARRAALHAHLVDRDTRGVAPGRPQGGDRLGALHARGRARRIVDDPPPACGLVLAL